MTELHQLSEKLQDRAQKDSSREENVPVDSITTQCKAMLSRPYVKNYYQVYSTKKDSHDIPQLAYDIDPDV